MSQKREINKKALSNAALLKSTRASKCFLTPRWSLARGGKRILSSCGEENADASTVHATLQWIFASRKVSHSALLRSLRYNKESTMIVHTVENRWVIFGWPFGSHPNVEPGVVGREDQSSEIPW